MTSSTNDLAFNLELIERDYCVVRQQCPSALFDTSQSLNPILYDGNPESDIMIIARDLGRDEVKLRRPLIGRAGRLLREACGDVKLDVEQDVYMTNLVPYKPKANKVFPLEVRRKFLDLLRMQVKLIKPKVIITLGKEAFETIREQKISYVLQSMRHIYKKKLFQIENVIGSGIDVEHFPAVHPSFLLRKGWYLNTPEYKDFMWKPLRAAKIIIERS